jgi:hypothetical protein
VTRGIIGYVADNPEKIYKGRADPTTDVGTYDYWAYNMHDLGNWPYRDFLIEYPPGVIPAVYWERPIDVFDYRTEFIAEMIVVDALGLVAIYRLARRTGVWWGVAAWLVLLPLLGPVAYTRLDLLVAAALAWMLERAYIQRWGGSGVGLGIGFVAKLTPALLFPAMFVVTPQRKRFTVAAAVVTVIAILPFTPMLGDLWHDAVGFHSSRGVQGESMWGSAVLGYRWLTGAPFHLFFEYGSWDVRGPLEEPIKWLSNAIAAAVVLGSAVVAWRRIARNDVVSLSVLLLATLSLLVVAGRVVSPQYFVWLIALAAVALTLAPRASFVPTALLSAAVVLAHLLYPIFFYDYFTEAGYVVALLLTRNLLVLATGITAGYSLVSRRREYSLAG